MLYTIYTNKSPEGHPPQKNKHRRFTFHNYSTTSFMEASQSSQPSGAAELEKALMKTLKDLQDMHTLTNSYQENNSEVFFNKMWVEFSSSSMRPHLYVAIHSNEFVDGLSDMESKKNVNFDIPLEALRYTIHALLPLFVWKCTYAPYLQLYWSRCQQQSWTLF